MSQHVHKLNHSRAMHRVAVIGCGGTGSVLIGGLPFLHQVLTAIGRPGLQVIIGDGDRVSPTNGVRQPFSESEIGLFKIIRGSACHLERHLYE
jgi:tRNA A37 threonylcarbamoyladenosine dehydratase